jgi:hypothetical protein
MALALYECAETLNKYNTIVDESWDILLKLSSWAVQGLPNWHPSEECDIKTDHDVLGYSLERAQHMDEIC